MSNHICKESRTCICYKLADAPDENCPMHGIVWPPRCEECGRFMSWETRNETRIIYDVWEDDI